MPDTSKSLIRSRLLQHARDHGVLYDHVLRQYAQERVLHRMASSKGNEGTLLRGGWAMAVRLGVPHRRLTNLDLLCTVSADPGAFLTEIRGIGGTTADGLVLDGGSIRTRNLRDGVGVRIRMFGYLDNAQIPLQLDVGFGHALVPAPEVLQLPSMLDQPGAPTLGVCRFETVAAEAVGSVVLRGPLTLKMADIYDIWLCLQVDPMEDLELALQAAFFATGTPIPGEVPYVLTEQFASSDHARKNWLAFQKGASLTTEIGLGEAVGTIRDAVMPMFEAACV